MSEKNILFVNPGEDRSLDKVVHRALMAAGGRVTISENAQESLPQLEGKKYAAAMINYDALDGSGRALVSQLLSRPSQPPTILLSQKREKEHLLELFSHDRLRNLVARNTQVSEEELIITTEKLLRKDLFGLEKYLVWGIHLVEEPLKDSNEKSDHVARVGEFVRDLKCDSRFVRLAEMVADELVMNVFYDAPVDAKGKPLYAHLPRTERIQLDDKSRGKLVYGSDGRFFAIACRDHFGALEAKTVVSYLRKCFVQDDRQIDAKPGGAGVGFFMIFQSVNQLVINIEPGKMTEIIGLIDIRSTYRDTKARTKSFNIFVKEA